VESYETPMVVVPTYHRSVIKAYNQKLRPSDRVLFRNQRAWLLEADGLRETQRKWAVDKYGPPSLGDILTRIQIATYYLQKGVSNRQAYQWKQRFFLEEMALLVMASVLGLAGRPHKVPLQYMFYDAEHSFLGKGLSKTELQLAHRSPEGLIPITMCSVRGVRVVCPWTVVTKAWQGADITRSFTRSAKPPPKYISEAELIESMWPLLPRTNRVELLAPLFCVAENMESYPNPEHLVRGYEAQQAPEWLHSDRYQDAKVDPIREVPSDPHESPLRIEDILRNLP